MHLRILAAAAALLVLAMVPARANLVANGNFESCSAVDQTPPSGWSGTGAFCESGFDEGPHTGTWAAFFGFVGALGSISQTITTTPGATYEFSFWYASDGGLPNEFQAIFDGVTVFDVVNDPAHGYVLEDFFVVASTSSTVITFAGQNDPSWQALDDVSVDPTTVVSEPATVAILGLGLIGLGAIGRRRSA